MYDCEDNTVTNAREQVGSSFKPYVLSTAVQQGMNVQNSILNSSTYLCVPPDGEPMQYSEAISAAVYNDNPGSADSCGCKTRTPQARERRRRDHRQAGRAEGGQHYGSHVQNALAQSSNTAFTDLAHRDHRRVVQMARNYGVEDP